MQGTLTKTTTLGFSYEQDFHHHDGVPMPPREKRKENMNHYFFWLDLESTGLDETQHKILEVAYVITSTDLKEILKYSTVISVSDWKELANDYVREMHEKSGLACEIAASGTSLEIVERQLLRDLQLILDMDEGETRIYLAGSSINFEQRWLRHHMPKVFEKLHYRMLDVSTLKLAFGPHGLEKPKKLHRAAADIRESLGVLQHFRKFIDFDPTGYD